MIFSKLMAVVTGLVMMAYVFTGASSEIVIGLSILTVLWMILAQLEKLNGE